MLSPPIIFSAAVARIDRKTRLPLFSSFIRLCLLIGLTLGMTSGTLLAAPVHAAAVSKAAMASMSAADMPADCHMAQPASHHSDGDMAVAPHHPVKSTEHKAPSGKMDCCSMQCQPVYLPALPHFTASVPQADAPAIGRPGFSLESGPKPLLLRPPILI